MTAQEQTARLTQIIEAQLGNQVFQLARQAVEIEALKAQLSQALADLAKAQAGDA
jgi:hypothetical protein